MLARRLSLDASAVAGRSIASFVRELARAADLDDHETYRLRLAADEIATNVAQHGYRGGPGGVELAGGFDTEQVWLRIEDCSPRFDPTGHDPRPRLDTGLRDGPEGGFGLFIAMRQVDSFQYEYCDGRNLNTLVIRRRGGGSAIAGCDRGEFHDH